jgi:hypothetical protein
MGFPKVTVAIIDQTFQQPTTPKGVVALCVQTQKGPVAKSVFCRSWQEYRETFGEIVNPTDTLGPVYAKRYFDAGGQAFISRVLHFADINDKDTFTAAIAQANNGGVFAFDLPIVAVDIANDTLVIRGDYTDYITVGQVHTVQKAGGGTTALTVAAPGASYAGGLTTIKYAAIVIGDAASGDDVTWSITITATALFKASSPGAWGNSIELRISRAASGASGKIDIRATPKNNGVLGTDLAEVYSNFSASPTAGEIQAFNEFMKLIVLDTVITAPIGVCPAKDLAGGTDDYASVADIDYIGSVTEGTGIRVFDEESGFVKIACPERATNLLDNALLDYVVERKDCLAILRTPESLNAAGAIDYRNCTGSFAFGQKIDNWRAVMLYGGLKVTSPYAPDNGAEITIGWISDFLGLSAQKDRNFGEWYSISNFARGTISNVRDIVYNVNTPNRSQEAEDLTAAGLFPIVKKKLNGVQTVVSWGYKSLQVAASSLQFANVAELVIAVVNAVRPLSESELFNPNDVLTWKAIYRKVDEYMLSVQNARGITAYVYEGDQNVDNASQAVINTSTTVAQGIYKFNLYFTPIVTLVEVRITGIITADGVLVSTEA